MKPETIKSNLRHIVLLAKEYKEKIPDSINNEIIQLQTAIRNGDGLNKYDRNYYHSLRKEKHKIERDTYQQIIYFAEKILLQLTKPLARSFIIDFDQEKIDAVLKELSKEEGNLLGTLYELQFNLEELECYKKGVYKHSEIKELKPEINKVMDSAVVVNV